MLLARYGKVPTLWPAFRIIVDETLPGRDLNDQIRPIWLKHARRVPSDTNDPDIWRGFSKKLPFAGAGQPWTGDICAASPERYSPPATGVLCKARGFSSVRWRGAATKRPCHKPTPAPTARSQRGGTRLFCCPGDAGQQQRAGSAAEVAQLPYAAAAACCILCYQQNMAALDLLPRVACIICSMQPGEARRLCLLVSYRR